MFYQGHLFSFLEALKMKKTVCSVFNVLIRMKCKKCLSPRTVRYGKNRSGVQRYLCKDCHCSFQNDYRYISCTLSDREIISLVKESCGIRSIGRILSISPSTVVRRILKIARSLKRPYPVLKGKIYEVDELFTYVRYKDNRICIAYSYESKTGHVLDISVGRRNKTNLRKVTETLVLSDAKAIYTDGLDIYQKLIPESIHKIHRRCTNHIERQNLTLRTHLKRLNRRTICYSKSVVMLFAIVKIYFWG